MRLKEFYQTDQLLESALDEAMPSWMKKAAVIGGLSGAFGATVALNPNTGKVPTEPTAITQQAADKKPVAHVQIPSIRNRTYERILRNIAIRNGIKGTELAAFMAQCAHETSGFSTLREKGTPEYFAKKYDIKYNPDKAEELGNTRKGDGIRYRGRGFIQITGRDNYSTAGDELNLPLELHPDLAEKNLRVAAEVSVWYWLNHVRPNVKDFTDVKNVTKFINPGMLGLPERTEWFKKYMGLG